MKNAIIIHGTCDREEYFSDKYPSLSNSHWLPWLQKQLLINNILAQTPEMPDAYEPDYEKWKNEFEKSDINEETILVGHSCGGGFLLRWLSESKINVRKLVLVAPWIDPKKRKTKEFFDFKIDEKIQERISEIHILMSKDDASDILESVEIIRANLSKIIYHEFKDLGHFTYSHMKTDAFPDLLDIIIK